jgi:uncharacterized membrane protein (UPF0127 family)
MQIINSSSDTAIATDAQVARSFWRRLRGLIGYRTLPEGGGMVFPRNGSVHTFWMSFPIDVLFADRDGVVVGMREALPPNRPYAGARRAYWTVELPAGTIGRTGSRLGDRLTFVD